MIAFLVCQPHCPKPIALTPEPDSIALWILGTLLVALYLGGLRRQ